MARKFVQPPPSAENHPCHEADDQGIQWMLPHPTTQTRMARDSTQPCLRHLDSQRMSRCTIHNNIAAPMSATPAAALAASGGVANVMT